MATHTDQPDLPRTRLECHRRPFQSAHPHLSHHHQASLTQAKEKRSCLDRYVIRYTIRRLLRYAKYAAAGALVAAVGGLLGTLGGPLAFFAAPGILMGSALGLGMGVIKVCHPSLTVSPPGTFCREATRCTSAHKTEPALALPAPL